MNYFDMDTTMNSGYVANDMTAINSTIKNLSGKTESEINKLMNMQAIHADPQKAWPHADNGAALKDKSRPNRFEHRNYLSDWAFYIPPNTKFYAYHPSKEGGCDYRYFKEGINYGWLFEVRQ